MTRPENRPLRCWAEIDLSALERNLNAIQAALPPNIRYIAVVKADAYGHGMHQTVARLMHAGIDVFAVANVFEATAIREIGSGWPILVLSSTLEDEESFLFEYDLIPTVSTVDEVVRLNQKAAQRGTRLKVHLKIDTGMGRLGVWHTLAKSLLGTIREAVHIELNGVYTHFASADTDADFTEVQRKRFAAALQEADWLEKDRLLIHADNSAGIRTFSPQSLYNAVRVGLLQFGISPHPNSLFQSVPTLPIISFKSRIGIVKELPAGAEISYQRTYRLERDSRIAVVCAGYGDGVPLSLSNRAAVIAQGQRCPVLGRITMDQTIIDVTNLPSVPSSGDEVCFIGKQGDSEIRMEEFSAWANTIPWEALCSITQRVTRIYRTSIITG